MTLTDIIVPNMRDVRAARSAAGDTQAAAAERIYVTLRMWQHYEDGKSIMKPGLWELYLLKTKALSRPRG